MLEPHTARISLAMHVIEAILALYAPSYLVLAITKTRQSPLVKLEGDLALHAALSMHTWKV